MGRKKAHIYIKKGASPLYKRPTIPIKIFVVPRSNQSPHYRTYYVAKFGKKLYKYSGVYGAKTKVGEFSKYITYKDEIKELLKEKKLNKSIFKELFGSKFTKYLGLFSGVASAYRDKMLIEKEGIPFKVGVWSYDEMIKSHKSRIKGNVWEETLELKNGVIVKTKLTITDPTLNKFKLETEVIDQNGNVSKKLLEGKVKYKDLGIGKARVLELSNIQNYSPDELVHFLSFAQHKFDIMYFEKDKVKDLDPSMLITLKQVGFVNSEPYTFSWLNNNKDQELLDLQSRIRKMLNAGVFEKHERGYVLELIDAIDSVLNRDTIPHNIDTIFLELNKRGLLDLIFKDKLGKLMRSYILGDLEKHKSDTYTLVFQNNIAYTQVPISAQDTKIKDVYIKSGLSRIILHAYMVQNSWENDFHMGYKLDLNQDKNKKQKK